MKCHNDWRASPLGWFGTTTAPFKGLVLGRPHHMRLRRAPGFLVLFQGKTLLRTVCGRLEPNHDVFIAYKFHLRVSRLSRAQNYRDVSFRVIRPLTAVLRLSNLCALATAKNSNNALRRSHPCGRSCSSSNSITFGGPIRIEGILRRAGSLHGRCAGRNGRIPRLQQLHCTPRRK